MRTHDGQRSPATWTRDIPRAVWQRAVDALESATTSGARIVLACHVDPDGDALGSMLALDLHLRRRGARTTASWGSEPFQVPPQYAFLPGLDRLTPPDQVHGPVDLLVTLDCSTPARLGLLEPLVEQAATVIVIDHHANTRSFGDVELVAPRAAATAVVVEELLHRLGAELDRDLATCIYVGLVTDTGRFQYANTDRAAMELGSRLLDRGIDHERMSRQIFETHSFGYLKVQGRVLERATFLPEASVVYSWVTQDDLHELGVALEETEGLIDVLRSVESAEIAMIARQAPAGEWKVSMRSKGAVDVGTMAAGLDGGGHTFASGFSFRGSIDALVAEVVAALDAARRLPTPEPQP